MRRLEGTESLTGELDSTHTLEGTVSLTGELDSTDTHGGSCVGVVEIADFWAQSRLHAGLIHFD